MTFPEKESQKLSQMKSYKTKAFQLTKEAKIQQIKITMN